MSASYQPKDYLREALNWLGLEGTEENGFWTMTQIAKLYKNSITRNDVGQKLHALGYRTSDGHPTQKAYSAGLVAPRGNPKYTWAWHQQKTCAILDEEAGWIRK